MQNFSDTFQSMRWEHNEINISHIQKHTSYTGSHKRFLIRYGLFFETVECVFSIVFLGLFLSYEIITHSVMRKRFNDIIQYYSKVVKYFVSY